MVRGAGKGTRPVQLPWVHNPEFRVESNPKAPTTTHYPHTQ